MEFNEITEDLLKYSKENDYYINVYDMVLTKEDPSTWNKRKRVSKELKRQVCDLIVSGKLYPGDWFDVFGVSEPYVLTMWCHSVGVKPNINGIYREDIKKLTVNRNMKKFGKAHPSQTEEVREKVKQTNLEKFGVDNPFKSPEVKERIKRTNIEKFGTPIPFQNPEVVEAFKENFKAKHGVDNPMKVGEFKNKAQDTNFKRYGSKRPLGSPEIQAKFRQTNRERYGVEIPSQSPEIKDKVKDYFVEKFGFENPFLNPETQAKAHCTNMEKYGSKNPFGAPEIQEKIRQTNMEKYGAHTPLLVPKIREKIHQTNIEKRGTHYPSLNSKKGQEFYERYQQLQDFRKAKELGALDKEECQRWILGAEWSYCQELSLLKELCDKESKEYTTELKIASLLDNLNVPYSRKAKKAHGVRNKNNQLIELDFWFPELRLGIEINGLAYHSVNKIAYGEPKERGYHFEKFFAFHSSGIKMISFTDHDLKSKWDSVTNIIKHHLKLEDIQDNTLVDFPDLYRSFNYGLFDFQFPENPNFEDYCEAKFIDGWEYWDCGTVKSVV